MYDTIVIGNDVSSFVAATLMAHHGGKTVLLSEGDAQYVHTESGYTFNIDPFPLTGFGPEQICTRLYASLGIERDEIPAPRLLNPCFQLILPNHRIDFFHDEERLFNEMEREFAGHAGDIRRLYMSAFTMYEFFQQSIRKNSNCFPRNYEEFMSCMKQIPLIMKEKIQLSKTLHAMSKNPTLYKIFTAHMPLFSHYVQAARIPSNFFTAYALTAPFRGIYYHPLGKESLIRSLRSIFIKLGGHMLNDCAVTNVGMEKEINVDIDSDEKMSTIKGKSLIASTKWDKFTPLLLNNRKFRRLKRTLKSLQTLYYPFTLHIGVHENGIPDMMAPYSAILDFTNDAGWGITIVFVTLSLSGDTEHAPAGKRTLGATVFLKESPLTLTEGELDSICSSVMENLTAVLPFLKENIDYMNVKTSIEIAKKCYGLTVRKYGMDKAPLRDLQTISCKTPLRNVFITGEMLQAGLGLDGEIVSGVNAAKALMKQEE